MNWTTRFLRYMKSNMSVYVVAAAKLKKGELAFALCLSVAEWTGLEPATPGVTGRYSNQLNYHSRIRIDRCWWVLRGSNSRHSPCKGDALPTELSTRAPVVGRQAIAAGMPNARTHVTARAPASDRLKND